MAVISRTCPECHNQTSSGVGDRVVGGELVWSESFRCLHCGCAIEIDGKGVAEFAVRQAILAETGLWGWHVAATGPALLKTLIQIRQKLDLQIAAIAAIKSRAPGILAVGTRAEIELLVEIATDAGLESLAEAVPSNHYAPPDFAVFSLRSGREKRREERA